MFNKAVKTESKLRMAIAGPSGSGKTYTALAVASALVPGGRIAVIDTEHGSAAKYADLFSFDVANAAPPYHPDGLVRLVTFAANNGYDVVIVDSVSHYWNGAGGVLDLQEAATLRTTSKNSYMAWKEVTPIHQRMVDTLIAIPAHVIVTMRSKQDYILVTNEKGRQEPKKVGMAPVQRDGFEYEFDVMLDMDIENVGRVQKTRCPALTGAAFTKPGADMAGILRDWLSGAAPAQAAPPVVFTPPAASPAAPKANGKPARVVLDVYPARTYGDGTTIPGDMTKSIRAFDAYLEAHGHAPEDYPTLKEWAKSLSDAPAQAAQAALVTVAPDTANGGGAYQD